MDNNQSLNQNENVPQTEHEAVAENAFNPNDRADKFRKIFSQPLFLAVCILMTIFVVLGFFTSGAGIINLLLMISFWIIYSNSKKNISLTSGLKFTNGVMKAQYIISYVIPGLALAICIPLALFMLFVILVNGKNESAAIFLLVWIFIFFIIFVTTIVFNAVFTRRICKFTKSLVDKSANPNAAITDINVTKGWIMFSGIAMAVFAGLSVISMFTGSFSISSIMGGELAEYAFMKNIMEYIARTNYLFAMVANGTHAAALICISRFIKNNENAL